MCFLATLWYLYVVDFTLKHIFSPPWVSKWSKSFWHHDESVEFAVKLVERQRFGFISTTFIHTQLHSMKAKYRLKSCWKGGRGGALWYVEERTKHWVWNKCWNRSTVNKFIRMKLITQHRWRAVLFVSESLLASPSEFPFAVPPPWLVSSIFAFFQDKTLLKKRLIEQYWDVTGSTLLLWGETSFICRDDFL